MDIPITGFFDDEKQLMPLFDEPRPKPPPPREAGHLPPYLEATHISFYEKMGMTHAHCLETYPCRHIT